MKINNLSSSKTLLASSRAAKHLPFPTPVKESESDRREWREFRDATKKAKASPRSLKTLVVIREGIKTAFPVKRELLFAKGYQTEPDKRKRKKSNGRSILNVEPKS